MEFNKFKVKDPYYNGYTLLTKKDKNGSVPEIFISTSNRSAGKSTFFSAYAVKKFIQTGQKFALLVKTKQEIQGTVEPFYSRIRHFFPELVVEQRKGKKSVYDTIIMGKEGDEDGSTFIKCGYVFALSAAEEIKKVSTQFEDVDLVLADEWFPENDKYRNDEIIHFNSIRKSIGRGGGAQTRKVTFIIIGNLINPYNPYFDTLGISDNLDISAKFVRGDGWVLEQGFNQAAAEADAASGFSKAMERSGYNSQTQKKEYLIDKSQFIDNKICDIGAYYCTIDYSGFSYSVRYNWQGGFYYISDTPDPSQILHHAATEEDISGCAIYDISNQKRKALKKSYNRDCVRFKNMRCKTAFMKFIIGR